MSRAEVFQAFREAVELLEWYEKQFNPGYTVEQLTKIEAGLQGDQRTVYGMLWRTKLWLEVHGGHPAPRGANGPKREDYYPDFTR